MDTFIDAVASQIENWPNILEAINPVDKFIASALTKDGPVHICPSAWAVRTSHHSNKCSVRH
jgi:hypothetical protein